MAAKNSTTPIIANPCAALVGVSVRSDGTYENIGIGTFPTEQSGAISERLVALAEAIRAAADRRMALIAR